MAAKGSKNGKGKPAAPKPSAKPAASPKVAAVAAKKAAPVVKAEIVTPPAPEPAPVAEAVVQEAIAEVETVGAVEAEAVPVETPIVVTVEAVVSEAIIESVAAAEVVTEAIKETKVMETIETNIAKAQAFFADFNDRAKIAVEKSTKLVEEANEFAKGNVEAFVESGKITAKGLELFGQEAAEFSRKSFETATAALKGMAAVKSPTEFFKLQSDFFRTSFDTAVAETSKNTEALMKLAGEVAQPLSSRVALAAEKAKLAA